MILSYNKMQEIKPCSKNNKARREQIIAETEFLDFQKLVGKDIYNKLVTDTSTTSIDPTLQGILNDGLYATIAYLVYSHYIQEISVVDTFSGMVQKQRDEASPIPQGTIKNIAIHSREIAEQYFSVVCDRLREFYCEEPTLTVEDGFSEIYSVRRVGGGRRRRLNTNYM